MKKRDIAHPYDARTAGIKGKLEKEKAAIDDNCLMCHAIVRCDRKAPGINIFKLSRAYYFKHFFYDSELFRELEQYYEKQRYRFRRATAGREM